MEERLPTLESILLICLIAWTRGSAWRNHSTKLALMKCNEFQYSHWEPIAVSKLVWPCMRVASGQV